MEELSGFYFCFNDKKRRLPGNSTEFSIDVGIVYLDRDGYWHRLIHKKTGNYQDDEWIWNQGPNANELDERVNSLKENALWSNVRETYLVKKNMYLIRGDKFHPSFVCYVEAVNEVYHQNFY